MLKSELRKVTLNKRAALLEQQRQEKSSYIADYVQSLPHYQNAKSVMIYLNYRDEVKTGTVAERILGQGKRLVVPYCFKEDIVPCQIIDLKRDLEIGIMGIPEPNPDNLREVDPQEIDLILVPGVGFDIHGNRIGYGRGYYDRFLPRLRPGVSFVGLAYECQIVDRISSEKHDIKMSLLITENGIIYPV